MFRVFCALSALIAASLLAVAGTGLAAADTDDSGTGPGPNLAVHDGIGSFDPAASGRPPAAKEGAVDRPAPVGPADRPGAAPAEQVPSSGAGAPRAGYPHYLHTASLGEVAAVALPGLAVLSLATAAGSLIGYRQANSCRYLRSGAVRFLR